MAKGSDSLSKAASDYFDGLIKSRFIEMFGSCENKVSIMDSCSLHARIGWQALTKDEHMQDGEYMLITGTDFQDGLVDYSTCKYISKERFEMDPNIQIHNEDILVTKDGSIGKVAIVKNLQHPATLNAGVFVVRPKVDDILPEYLMQCLKSREFELFIHRVKRGATISHLNQGIFFKFEIPKPPIQEQIKLINYVRQVDKSKLTFEKYVSKFDELVKSRFIEMFGNPIQNEFKLPVMKLSEVCSVITDGSHYSPVDTVDGVIPMLSVKDMNESGLDYSSCKHIDENTYLDLVKNGCEPQINDLLIAKDGSFFKCGVVIEEYRKQCILSSIAILRPNIDIVHPVFLKYYLLSDAIVDYVSRCCISGTALKRVILKEMRKIETVVPPIKLQNEFAEFVKQVDKSKSAVFESIKRMGL